MSGTAEDRPDPDDLNAIPVQLVQASVLRDDLKSSLRGFRRDPLYAAAVIGTLALTLGACTAVFSIVNGVLLRPLPYPAPGQLVSIREVVPQWARQYPTLPANARHFNEWRNRTTSFSSVAALDWRMPNVTGVGEPFQARILRASGTLFDVLRIPVARGRPLTRQDELPEQPRVAVIGNGFWRERFGNDPAVLGRTIKIGGTDHIIVGVLPPKFEIPDFDVLENTSSLQSDFSAVIPFRINLDDVGWMGTFNYAVIGRLQPGVTIEHARAELDVIQQSIAEIARRETQDPADLRSHISSLEDAVVGRARLGLLLLLGAVAAVVLIACANLANLSLSRALGRVRDAAVRTALGASRASLVRAVVLEQLVLAAAGGTLGLLIARGAIGAFVTTAPIDLPRAGDVVIDGRVLAFAATIAMLAGLTVALLPAWRIGRGDVQSMLRSGGHGSTDRGGARLRAALLTLQVALSVTLLVVTGLFVTSFMRLVGVDPGFSTDRVVAIDIVPISSRYPDTKARAALYDRITERARQMPGITTVAWTSALPLTGETWVDIIAGIEDTRPSAQKLHANYRFVGPDYFRALSMPILKGRSISDRDRTSAVTPAVISARAAQTLWPDDDPIGQPFTRANPKERFEVVGVVVDGHPTALDTESPLMVYVPYWYNNEGRSVLLAQTNSDPAIAIRELRDAIRVVDPEIAIGDAMPLVDVVNRAVEGRRYQMSLFVAFGTVALVIAVVGVYATTAYGVSRRRREMNIRVALGASTANVFGLVLRQSATPLVAGIAAGCGGALALGSVVAGLLFQVQPRDPVVMTSVGLVVAAAGLLAAGIAARHGLRINPVEALREE